VSELLAGLSAAPSAEGQDAESTTDGRSDTLWIGADDAQAWTWRVSFKEPVHVALLRAEFGLGPIQGVPVAYHWEVRTPARSARRCEDREDGFTTVEGTTRLDPPRVPGPGGAAPVGPFAEPTRRSWFVDLDACGLRFVVDKTNGGPPAIHEIEAIEGARDVLRDASAVDDGAWAGFHASDAIDGSYGTRWVGAPPGKAGRDRWTLTFRLPDPEPIDRVRLVLGFDAASRPRGIGPSESGRDYAIAWGPVRYDLQVSEDGRHFTTIASTPLRSDGSLLPLRRRLVRLARPENVRVLRLVMDGATNGNGAPDPAAAPVVREVAAYRGDDPRHVLAPPWILSVNANPMAEMHRCRGGELANDIYYAKFLYAKFGSILPPLRRDDRIARSLGAKGELLNAVPTDFAGEALEFIEGDDATLDASLFRSSPPPITVLSGSNDWDYASETMPDPRNPERWRWDPLRDAQDAGLGRLSRVVKDRTAPMLGFCGGAQILALLEARVGDASSPELDGQIIDRVLRRTTGRLIRGFAPPIDIDRSWPGDGRQPGEISFLPDDRLFVDIAGLTGRRTSRAFPESHVDAIRPDAFAPDGPLRRFSIVATSAFCGADVVPTSPRDPAIPNPTGPGRCATIPEVFRSRGDGYPIIGTQVHAEQRDFLKAAPGDPPESVADPRLLLAAAYEEIVDAYIRYAP
jgi:hypothetical protein